MNCQRIQLLGSLSDLVGYRSGLLLTQAEMVAHAPGYEQDLDGDLDDGVRLHSSDYEQLVVDLLYAVGYTKSKSTSSPHLQLAIKYRTDPEAQEALHFVVSEFMEMAEEFHLQQVPFDVNRFATRVLSKRKGLVGRILVEFIDLLIEYFQRAPFGHYRSVLWRDQIELDGLFASESLQVSHGDYLDQRFIDYLERNFDSIDRMNWRKFEGLAAEYFARAGYAIEIGQGRNDDGIDLRAWSKGESTQKVPTIIVQCKRTKRQVEKVVVKGLWADMVDANAQSGIIVTTSVLSPGAAKTCAARSYKITAVDRPAIRKWLTAARTPLSGVFLSE